MTYTVIRPFKDMRDQEFVTSLLTGFNSAGSIFITDEVVKKATEEVEETTEEAKEATEEVEETTEEAKEATEEVEEATEEAKEATEEVEEATEEKPKRKKATKKEEE